MNTFKSASHRGFTLIELLVVIAIIGILASVVLASLNSARDKGKQANVESELNSVRKAMELLFTDTGVYPNGASSFCRTSPPSNNEIDLNSANAGLNANGSGFSGWSGPYVNGVLTDPWGTPYYLDEDYTCNSSWEHCGGASGDISVLVSCGPDADNGGAGGSCEYNADNIVYRLCG